MTFHQSLAFGQAGESVIAYILRSRGNFVLPAYEKEQCDFKGPRVYGPNGTYVATDLFVFNKSRGLWIEAKHKSAFTWHRKTERWTTGIDLPHYEDYCFVADQSPWPVWLLFLHQPGQAKDSPSGCPSGLFGNDLAYLRRHVNHRHENGGKRGMVYWAHQDLKLIASDSDIAAVRAMAGMLA